MAGALLDSLELDRGSRVIAVVNGLGATTQLELYGIYDRFARALADRGIEISRKLVGSMVTALDMHGFSLTVSKMDDELIELWDAPARTPAWNVRDEEGDR